MHRIDQTVEASDAGGAGRPPIAVIGAGPAGLTSAMELERLGEPCVVFEADPERVGGIARTEQYKGYRFDIGGHRFFTKSDEVRELWHEFLPEEDFLTVPRISRIYYKGRFFDYPIRAGNALRQLGVIEAARCALSFFVAQLRRTGDARSFEDWVVQRFGRRLFEIFFKTYTEKVWGMPCGEISADWAAQRIKGLNLYEAVRQSLVRRNDGEVIKTLIDEFEYPRYGPGMMWERVADRLEASGTPVQMGAKVVGLHHADGRLRAVTVEGREGRATRDVSGAISTMPLRSLVRGLRPSAPEAIQRAAEGLHYRDFVSVVLVVDVEDLFPDNWIYIHDPDVSVGRVQNYKNWSPAMVPDPSHTCVGLEYFCFDDDGIWTASDEELIALGTREMAQIGLLDPATVLDGAVIRMRKAYPVYDDSYRTNVDIVRRYLRETVPNLELCGRNGMHKYNNQDHAMMTGLMAARNLAGDSWDQWLVNADAEYHEEERVGDTGGRLVPMPLTESVGG